MRRRQRELMVQFEDFFATEPPSEMSIPAITSALGVSDRFLRSSCKEQLGMSPLSYLRFRRLQSARRDLRHAAPDTLTVTEAGRRYGFHDRGRFAAAYRRLFGEQPSVTLHMGPNQPMPELTLRRRPRRTPRPASQLS
jgi:AraC-like DNA-binding protein